MPRNVEDSVLGKACHEILPQVNLIPSKELPV